MERKPWIGLVIIRLAFQDVRSTLTTLCGLFLVASFVPGLAWLAYLAALCGSYHAILSAWESIKGRTLDVNLLMVLAAVGAIAVGQIADAAGLLFLFSLSTTLESLAMARTRSAIDGLIRLRPSQAARIRDGVSEMVPVESLVLGDLVRVPAFDSVPTDGEIVEGKSSLDQSAMTGESVSVACGPGDRVIGGTQNLDGTLVIRVTATVGDSALDRIVSLVQDAQENKASGEKISEWFGQRYTVVVLLAFGASLAVRLALGELPRDAFYASLTLLVGMSPCALVISTPATTLSAIAWCARNGILVRGGEFIERIGLIKVVAADKTGTLTLGKPSLRALEFYADRLVEFDGKGEMDPLLQKELALAAAVEQYSNHPIATAVVRSAAEQGLTIPDATDHRVVPGLGVAATVEGGRCLVGLSALMDAEGVAVPSDLRTRVAELRAQGMTVSLVSTPGGVGALAFSDEVRGGAAQFVSDLRNLGIESVVMLTGDRAETAEAVAKVVGITEIHGGLLPGQKTAHIEELTQRGPVMMIGDGVNDAPSLAMASVGVAMGGLGSDVALNAADIVLMHDRIERIADLVRFGRQTVRTIRANLVFAGGVIVCLTVASLVTKVPLPLAVVGHEGSTVLVILNGLRMLRGPASDRPT